MAVNTCSTAEMQAVLERLPQKPPFLFIDRILELNEHLIDDEEKIYPGQILTLPVTAVSDQKKSNPPTAQLPQPAPPVEKKENPIPPVRKVATSEQSSTLRPPPAAKPEPG